MKKILILFLYFLSQDVISQTFESLKNSDEIFIYFDHGKNQESFVQKNIGGDDVAIMYYVYFCGNQFKYLLFSHSTLTGAFKRTEEKAFLKKNKERIVKTDFFKKFELSEMTKLFDGKKKIYIIDIDNITKKTVTLTEVRVKSSIPNEM